MARKQKRRWTEEEEEEEKELEGRSRNVGSESHSRIPGSDVQITIRVDKWVRSTSGGKASRTGKRVGCSYLVTAFGNLENLLLGREHCPIFESSGETEMLPRVE